MGGYLVNFTVYTMAMLGLISFAVFVFKKFTDGTMRSNKSKFLDVEDSMSLSPRKTLHVVRAGNERFLIASDIDRTTLISKLDAPQTIQKTENLERFRNIELEQPTQFQNFQEEIQLLPQQVHLEPIRGRNPEAPMRRGMDRRATSNIEVQKSHGFSTMKEMAMKINEL
ncbi:FliO/MopB family protein [bacterium]|nr:FliO/MopB family protein [bacterium]